MAHPVRIALTISGAVSLGAFEGGAMAALLTFVQCLGRLEPGDGHQWPVSVDVMSGASAGSITAVLAARVLTGGLDPVDTMHAAWVTAPSLQTLTRGGARAPLSPDGLRSEALAILAKPAAGPPQPSPVTVHIALTALAGLRHTIPDLARGHPLQATTHLDWAELSFEPGDTLAAWTTPEHASAIDFALASGASPLAFPPYAVHRRARPDDWATYLRNGVSGLPEDGWLWYTDGGTIENEPLGRTLDLAADSDRGWAGERLHILVHPHPTGGGGPGPWRGPDGPRGAWLRSLVRADRIQRTQTLFDDLRRAEKTNSRLVWRREMQRRLLEHRAGLDDPGRESFDGTVAALLADIGQDRSRLRAQAQGTEASPGSPAPTLEVDPARALEAVLDHVTGTGGQPVAFGVISPTALADDHRVTVEALLAGEHLFHFGGFLDDRLRAHDFAVGYDAALGWLAEATTGDGALAGAAPDALLQSSLQETTRVRLPWSLPAPTAGGAARWSALALAGRAAVLGLRDLAVWRPWRRGR